MNIETKKHKIVYRYRNKDNILEEIEFYLNYPEENPIDIVEDMVRQNLLLGRDAAIVSHNITRLLKSKTQETNELYFPLYDKKHELVTNTCKEIKILKRGYGCLFISNKYFKRKMYRDNNKH